MEFERNTRYDDGTFDSQGERMASVQEIVGRQKDGAQFVISAQMLRMKPQEFDALAQQWIADGGADGFELIGVPHRCVVDGEFFVDRVTAVRTA